MWQLFSFISCFSFKNSIHIATALCFLLNKEAYWKVSLLLMGLFCLLFRNNDLQWFGA